jgi:hypothetical protein
VHNTVAQINIVLTSNVISGPVWLLDETTVLVETSISFADFGEHHSRAENGASGTENCESRKKMAVIDLA